jgi:hypothetical protein
MMINSRCAQIERKGNFMDLATGLEILVDDWRDLHEDGGTELTVDEVVGRLDIGSREKEIPRLGAAEVAGLIMEALGKIPGAVGNAEKFMAQFDSADDLLEEIDLECLVSDLLQLEDEEF